MAFPPCAHLIFSQTIKILIMSEYQYYEWQTIDRPLDARELADVKRLSSHMDVVTSTQAVVTYSWGDFKHDPREVLLKYFDTFLYDSNFGWRRLMFRLPKGLLDISSFQPYLLEDWIMLEEHGQFFVLEIQLNDEDNCLEWVESGGILGQLAPLRDQLLQGDTRMLYLAWLKAISVDDLEVAEHEPEPPLPAGLKELNAGLQAFAEFFEIDPHLIAAAAVASPDMKAGFESNFEASLSKLSRAECEFHLKQILLGAPGAVLALKKHLAQPDNEKTAAPKPPVHTVPELLKQARKIEEREARKAAQQAERERIRRLENLAENEEANWVYLESLLVQRRAYAYDEATQLLVELHDMALYKGKADQFAERFEVIRGKYGKSVALMGRFHRVGLVS